MTNNMFQQLAAASVVFLASISMVQAADYSAGGTIGSKGIGASFTGKTNWSLIESDQIQWRVAVSGLALGSVDDDEVSNIDYQADIGKVSLQGGVDWYPFSNQYADRFFFSGGVVYFYNEFDGVSKANQSFKVGDTQVQAGDNIRLHTEIEHASLAPYVSVGWGNRIREEAGFSFRAELGVLTALSDADVMVTTEEASSLISADDLAKEKREIEDDIDNVIGFVTVGLTYQF